LRRETTALAGKSSSGQPMARQIMITWSPGMPMSARGGFPVFVADRLEGAKRRNWKIVSCDEERDWWTPPANLGEPKAFDLITDPKEEQPQTGLRNAWNAGPALKVVAAFEASLKEPTDPAGNDRSLQAAQLTWFARRAAGGVQVSSSTAGLGR
jgi:hypothetical protein